MAEMPRGRETHSCGLVVNPDKGPEIIVMGGEGSGADTVDIYTVNTDRWREGNMTQYYFHYATGRLYNIPLTCRQSSATDNKGGFNNSILQGFLPPCGRL